MTFSKSENEKKSFWTGLRGFGAISLVITVFWGAWFWIAPKLFPETDKFGNVVPPSLGVSGDMFGGLTALFSGLAFAGLISMLLMQRKELELQRTELSQTREVFSIQRFEGTMFGLLKLLNDHVTVVEHTDRYYGISSQSVEYFGRKALERISELLPKQNVKIGGGEYNVENGETSAPIMVDRSFEDIVLAYQSAYSTKWEVQLGPYFRILYNIFRLIDEANFGGGGNSSIQKDYARMVRAHLSSSEVKLLLFNCAAPENYKFKQWVIKYALLKHLPASDREECSTICATYPPEAFGE